MSELLQQQHENGVLELVLNRPDKKNALTLAMYAGLVEALNSAAGNDQVRVVLLRGAGDSFTAGNDLADFVTCAQRPEGMQTIIDFLHTLVDFPKPLLAAVQGNAVGIGTTLLLHCDHVVVADNLKAQMPFVKLGLVPEGGSSLLVPGMLGQRQAFELLVQGGLINAERACQLGIANQQVAVEQLHDQALAAAAAIIALPQQAVEQSKAMLRAPQRAALHQVIDEEGQQFVQRLTSEEAQAILSGFLNRR